MTPSLRIHSFILMVLVGVVGCSSAVRQFPYGRSAGQAGKSIHGTGLLAELFRDAGHSVTTARTLGRTVESANVVVWFPDTIRAPQNQTCKFFEKWLTGQPRRTLIYVGREYGTEQAYWQRLVDETPAASDPGEAYRLRRWSARAKADQLTSQTAEHYTVFTSKWFTTRQRFTTGEVTELTGTWSRDVGRAKHPPRFSNTIQPVSFAEADTEVLLQSGDLLFATSLSKPHWRQNKLILLANGSTLVNLALTDSAYQKIAKRMISDCGNPGRVVFLNSGRFDPQVAKAQSTHHLLRVFTTPPLRCILMHLAALGIVYCVAVFPMLGLPQHIVMGIRTDFGNHVKALGRLLAMTKDEDYAYATRKAYFQRLRGTDEAPEPRATEAGNPFR